MDDNDEHGQKSPTDFVPELQLRAWHAYGIAGGVLVVVWLARIIPALSGMAPAVQGAMAAVALSAGVDVWLRAIGASELRLWLSTGTPWTLGNWLLVSSCMYLAILASTMVMGMLLPLGAVPFLAGLVGSGPDSPGSFLVSGSCVEPVIITMVLVLHVARRPISKIIVLALMGCTALSEYMDMAEFASIGVWVPVSVMLWLKYRNLPALIVGYTMYSLTRVVMAYVARA